jgi:hypothetical protein
MPKTIFDATSRQQILDRISRLRADTPPQFGKMTPSEMLCHMQDALKVGTGEVPTRPLKTFLRNPFIRRLVIYYMPWPKGKVQTVPEMLATRPAEFESDRARLKDLVLTTAARGPNAAWAVHPAFGAISGKDYGVLLYRHFDHHLRQFGV